MVSELGDINCNHIAAIAIWNNTKQLVEYLHQSDRTRPWSAIDGLTIDGECMDALHIFLAYCRLTRCKVEAIRLQPPSLYKSSKEVVVNLDRRKVDEHSETSILNETQQTCI